MGRNGRRPRRRNLVLRLGLLLSTFPALLVSARNVGSRVFRRKLAHHILRAKLKNVSGFARPLPGPQLTVPKYVTLPWYPIPTNIHSRKPPFKKTKQRQTGGRLSDAVRTTSNLHQPHPILRHLTQVVRAWMRVVWLAERASATYRNQAAQFAFPMAKRGHLCGTVATRVGESGLPSPKTIHQNYLPPFS